MLEAMGGMAAAVGTRWRHWMMSRWRRWGDMGPLETLDGDF